MKRNEHSIREAWTDLRPPEPGKGHRALQVQGTNAWVLREQNGRFGLLLHGVEQPVGAPDLRRIKIRYRPTVELHSKSRQAELKRCLEVFLETECDEGTVIRILDRLDEEHTDGNYTTDSLLATISDALEAFQRRPPPPPYEEVVGAWGEMFLLYLATRGATDTRTKVDLIRCWESQGQVRDIIDFRFTAASTAVEVKTAAGPRRHHIHGAGQVTVPADCPHGYLASIQVTEADHGGTTCAELLAQLASGVDEDSEALNELRATIEAKVAQRGRACKDDRFRFSQTDGGLRLLRMEDVPRPTVGPEILDVSWIVDLQDAGWLSASEVDALIESLSTGSSA